MRWRWRVAGDHQPPTLIWQVLDLKEDKLRLEEVALTAEEQVWNTASPPLFLPY